MENPKINIYGIGNREMAISRNGPSQWLNKQDVMQWLEWSLDDDSETENRIKELLENLK